MRGGVLPAKANSPKVRQALCPLRSRLRLLRGVEEGKERQLFLAGERPCASTKEKNNVRTMRIAVVAVAAAGLLVAGTQFRRKPSGGILPVVHASGGCSNSSLRGTFGAQFSGNVIGFGPIAGVALETYDGAGNFTFTQNVNVNGFPILNQPGSGTYSVNADCTGTKTFNPLNGQVIHLTFVIVGKEVFHVQTDPGAVVTAVSRPVGTVDE